MLFGRLKFEDAYRQKLRELKLLASELVNDYAARTSDLVSRAFPNYTTNAQLDIAVENFVAGLVNVSTGEYLRRERACRRIDWTETVQMAKASKLQRPADMIVHSATIRKTSTTCAKLLTIS